MMSFAEFKEAIKNEVIQRLPEEYAECKVEFNVIRKSGYSYEALMISPKVSSCVVPALNITDAYKQFDGSNLDKIADKLVDIRLNAKPDGEFNKEDMLDFDKVRDRIYPRLINTALNGEYLKDKVFKKYNDLSILYSVRVFETPTGCGEAVITEDLANHYGVTVDELHTIALDNLDKEDPVLCSIQSIVFHDGSGNLWEKVRDGKSLDGVDVPFFVLTSNNMHRGATQMLRDTVMRAIADKFGDVYIIPSSIDEVIIVPKNECDDPKMLTNMLRDVNSAEVKPEDRLSDNLYQWTIDNGLELV